MQLSKSTEFIFFPGIFLKPYLRPLFVVIFHCISALSYVETPFIIFIVLKSGFHIKQSHIFLKFCHFWRSVHNESWVLKLPATCLLTVVHSLFLKLLMQYYFFLYGAFSQRHLAGCDGLWSIFIYAALWAHSSWVSRYACSFWSCDSDWGFIALSYPPHFHLLPKLCGPQKINHFFCDSESTF